MTTKHARDNHATRIKHGNQKPKSEDFPAHMKPQVAPCEDCGITMETILLVNGQEKTRLCCVCLKDQIYDMAINNSDFAVINLDDSLECQ